MLTLAWGRAADVNRIYVQRRVQCSGIEWEWRFGARSAQTGDTRANSYAQDDNDRKHDAHDRYRAELRITAVAAAVIIAGIRDFGVEHLGQVD